MTQKPTQPLFRPVAAGRFFPRSCKHAHPQKTALLPMLTLRAMAALAQPFDFCAAVSHAHASHPARQRKATLCCGFRFFARKYLAVKK